MAISYQYCLIEGFPQIESGKEWMTQTQLGIPGVADNDSGMHSRIKHEGPSEYRAYTKYSVEHEESRKGLFRFQNQIRERVIQVFRFNLYVATSGEALFGAANNPHLRELLRRVEQSQKGFQFAQRTVRMQELQDAAQMAVRAGWFSELDIQDVTSVAVFGGSMVSQGQDWQRYQKAGKLGTLDIDYPIDNDTTRVKITKTGGVVLYENFSEEGGLKLVEEISEFVDRFSDLPKEWLDRETPG